MTVAAGVRLGRYELIAPLGAGGMGEVWRARDTRLGREVAIKVLPERLAKDSAALARLEREARAVAMLSHPHIVALHDIGHDGDVVFLVMELLVGETLEGRLRRGPLRLDEALAMASEVADALAAAHRLGVVHRDLKPGNVMLTKSGVKLLDFGLAKRTGPATTASAWDHRATGGEGEQTPLTVVGSLMGTLHYMAPEQLEGKEADGRSDLFAFGAMVYEAVSGQRAFPGSSPASVIAAILREDPRPLRELDPLSPVPLERLVRRCLAKDPEARWQSAADVAEALRWIGSSLSGTSDLAPTRLLELEGAPPPSGASAGRPWAVAAALLACCCVALAASLWRPGDAQPIRQVALPDPVQGTAVMVDFVEASPDGTKVAFVAYDAKDQSTLWVRDLGEREARRLPASDGAMAPFWSPDGQQLGFFAGGKLEKVALAGGPPVVLADAPGGLGGGSWSTRGWIAFAPQALDGIRIVSENGGVVRRVTRVGADEDSHLWPWFLPDGERFVFLADSSAAEKHRLRLGSVRGGDAPPILQAVSNPRFVPPDQLLYVRGGTLLAQRYDPDKGLLGTPVAIADRVAESYATTHHFQFSAARGLLTYRSADPQRRFVWVDRHDVRREPVGEPARYGAYALSQDQRRLAFERLDADGLWESIWWRDLERGVLTRVARSRGTTLVASPLWSEDGGELIYGVFEARRWRIERVDAADPGHPQPALVAPGDARPVAWSPAGHWLLFERTDGGSPTLWLAPAGGGEPRPWGDGARSMPVFSPDERQVAFVADSSGQPEVYVATLAGGAPIQLSIGGGSLPSWRADGRELYYTGLDDRIYAVSLDQGEKAPSAPPEPLFAVDAGDQPLDAEHAVCPSRDGQRFLLLENLENVEQTPVRLVLGWRPPS